MFHCFQVKSCLGDSQELKYQELMGGGGGGLFTHEPTTVVYTTRTQHNRQQHCDVKMETSSNNYRSLLSDIKYL